MKSSAAELLPTHLAMAESDGGERLRLQRGTLPTLCPPSTMAAVGRMEDWKQNKSSGSVRVSLRRTHGGLINEGEMVYSTITPPVPGQISNYTYRFVAWATKCPSMSSMTFRTNIGWRGLPIGVLLCSMACSQVNYLQEIWSVCQYHSSYG